MTHKSAVLICFVEKLKITYIKAHSKCAIVLCLTITPVGIGLMEVKFHILFTPTRGDRVSNS